MKKFIVAAVLAGAMSAFAAEDSYLLWMLPDEVTVGGKELTGTYKAKVIAGDSSSWAWNSTGNGGAGTYLNIYDSGAQNRGNEGVKVTFGDFIPGYFADAGSLGGTETFFIELWNDNSLVGVSEGLAYSSAGLGALAGTGKPADVWQNMTFVTAPIPEPNSGLLMLIGCALLGLRRKQKKA